MAVPYHLRWYKKLVIHVWSMWEGTYHRVNKLQLGDTNDLLYYKITSYKGQDLSLPGEDNIQAGDWIVELHFNNQKLLEAALGSASHLQMASQLVHSMRDTLRRMLDYIEHIDGDRPIKGLYGISLLHKGAEQFGFSVLDLPPTLPTKFKRIYLQILLCIMHPQGIKRMKQNSSGLNPKIIVVSKNKFKTAVKDMR